MKSYIDNLIVRDENGEEAILYPSTKKEAVEGLEEILAKLSAPDITETTETTMQNSNAGRLKVDEIGGVCEQDSTAGNQLFDSDSLSVQSVGNDNPTVTVEGKKVTVAGKASSAQAFYVVENLTNLIDKDVILSYEKLSSSNSNARAVLQLAVTNTDDTKNYYTADSSKSVKLNVANTITDLQVCIICNNSSSALETENVMTIEGIMLNVGSTALPWEKYTGGIPSPNPSYQQEIKKSVVSEIKTHGKNLAKSILPNVTTQWGVALWVDCDLKPSTQYTISFNGNSGNSYYFNEWLFTYAKVVDVTNERMIIVFKTKNELPKNASTYTESAGWIFLKNSIEQPSDNVFTKLQLEKGTVATDYEPYKESVITLSQPIELNGFGDVQDVITPKRIKRKYEYLRVTGSDVRTVTHYTETGNAISINKVAKINGKCLSNGFIGVSFNDRVKDVNSFRCYVDSTGYVVFRVPASENNNFMDKETVKSFFDNNEIFVAYELTEEITEALPIADQTALNSLSTYDGITYIEFDSEIKPTFKGEYGTSKVGGYTLEGMLAGRNGELYGKNYVDRITALEATVVNNI